MWRIVGGVREGMRWRGSKGCVCICQREKREWVMQGKDRVWTGKYEE